MAGDIARHHEIKIENIDVNRQGKDSCLTLFQELKMRNEGMEAELLKPKNSCGILLTGAGHAILCGQPALQKKFHIYNIGTSKNAFSETASELEENFSYLKQAHPVFFEENPIAYSKEVVDLLIKIIKARKTGKPVHSIFVENGIFPGGLKKMLSWNKNRVRWVS